jgi:hypothetical protein
MIRLFLLAMRDLLMASMAAAIVVGVFALYYHYNPSTSAEGSAWAAMDDAMSMGVIAILTVVVALVWWAMRVASRGNR